MYQLNPLNHRRERKLFPWGYNPVMRHLKYRHLSSDLALQNK